MTREEAGTVLELMLVTARTSFSEMEAEAVRMAVEALKEQERRVAKAKKGEKQ